jgi:hypothetical protein
MRRHHEVALEQALDELYLHGATSIRWEHLYCWFNATRLGRNAYREIISRWEELCAYYDHKEVPKLTVLYYEGCPALNLRREAFVTEDEGIPELAEWA